MKALDSNGNFIDKNLVYEMSDLAYYFYVFNCPNCPVQSTAMLCTEILHSSKMILRIKRMLCTNKIFSGSNLLLIFDKFLLL